MTRYTLEVKEIALTDELSSISCFIYDEAGNITRPEFARFLERLTDFDMCEMIVEEVTEAAMDEQDAYDFELDDIVLSVEGNSVFLEEEELTVPDLVSLVEQWWKAYSTILASVDEE